MVKGNQNRGGFTPALFHKTIPAGRTFVRLGPEIDHLGDQAGGAERKNAAACSCSPATVAPIQAANPPVAALVVARSG
jgi:hypothetical protein